MKTIKFFFACVIALCTLNLNVQAQSSDCNCKLKFDADKTLASNETTGTIDAPQWVTMDPVADHNKLSECGNRCILPAGTRVVVDKNTGEILRLWACNNKVLTWEPAGPAPQANQNQQNTQPNNQNNQNQNGQSSNSGQNDPCCGKVGAKEYLDLYAEHQEIERKNDAASNQNQINFEREMSNIRVQEKNADALAARSSSSGGGCGGCGSGGSGGGYVQYGTTNQGGGGNGVATADLVIDGAHFVYDVAADIFGVNGRFRRQRGGVTNNTTNVWGTIPDNGGGGTNPGGGWNPHGN